MERLGIFGINEAWRGRNVLLTGATGFVGKVWLGLFLERLPEAGKVFVLLRKKGGRSALQRMEDILNASPVFKGLHEIHGERLDHYLSSRLEAVEGDVSEENFGLSSLDFGRLSGQVDLVMNVAGHVEFLSDIRKSYRANVKGALNALELARAFKCPLLHISTAFVTGSKDGWIAEEAVRNFCPSGAAFDAESELSWLEKISALPEPPSGGTWVEEGSKRAESWGWPNVYSYSKSLAESLLWERAEDVPVSVFRPAIVESARRFPFPGWNEGITTCAPLSYLLWRWTRILQVSPGNHLDLIPVDTVCESLTVAAAALLKGVAKPVYHCGTSDRNPLTLRFAVDMMGLSHREYHRQSGRRSFEQKIFSRLQPQFVGENSFFTVDKMKRVAGLLLEAADLGSHYVPERAKDIFEFGRRHLRKARWDLVKAEKIMDSFRPYLCRFDYRFETKNLKSHDVREPEFAFRPEEISWSEYIVRVHEPGLRKWCYPLMEGKAVEAYRPARRCALSGPKIEKEEIAAVS